MATAGAGTDAILSDCKLTKSNVSDEETFEDAVESLSETHISHSLNTKNSCCQPGDCSSVDDDVPASGYDCSNDNNGLDNVSESDSKDQNFIDSDSEVNDVKDKGDEIDETALREQEANMSDETKKSRQEEALRLKELGNNKFTEGQYEAAIDLYTSALSVCLLSHANDRAILYANRAAARVRMDDKENAIVDCTKALEFNPDHLKALMRRAELYEKTDKLDEALEDYTKALERDPSLHAARAACMRLPDQIKDRNEKMKAEMLGKLKDLGNMILRPFGLSTSNFKLQQDPNTGSYSVSFQQQQQQQPST